MFPTSTQWQYCWFSVCQIIQELFQARNWVENPILLSLYVFNAVVGMIQDAENSIQLLLCAFKSWNTIMSFHYIQSCASLNGLSLQILPKFCHVPSNLRILSWVSIIFTHMRVLMGQVSKCCPNFGESLLIIYVPSNLRILSWQSSITFNHVRV